MLGTFGGALEARQIDASSGRLTADVTGEVESEDGVLVIKRIHVAMRLAAPEDTRATVERVHGVYAMRCPLHRTLLDRLEFAASDLRRPVREYSTGMKRKLGIVQAFQADAPLLVLDEPTEGLDPLMQEAFYELLGEVRRRGRTVFMSSHVVPEVERVCDRLALLREGRLALISTIEELRSLAGRRVRASFAADVDPPAAWPPDCEVISVAPRLWDMRVRGSIASFVSLVAARPLADLDVQTPRLEDVLRKYYAAQS